MNVTGGAVDPFISLIFTDKQRALELIRLSDIQQRTLYRRKIIDSIKQIPDDDLDSILYEIISSEMRTNGETMDPIWISAATPDDLFNKVFVLHLRYIVTGHQHRVAREVLNSFAKLFKIEILSLLIFKVDAPVKRNIVMSKLGNEPDYQDIVLTDKRRYLRIRDVLGNKTNLVSGGFFTDHIPFPAHTYPLDAERINDLLLKQKMCPQSDPNLYNGLKILLRNTQHVSMDIFLDNIRKSCKRFISAMGSNKYVMLVPFDTEAGDDTYLRKSNYWMSQISYHILKKLGSSPVEVVNKLDVRHYGYNKENCGHVVTCDDGIYSGQQMNSNVIGGYVNTYGIRNATRDNSFIHLHIICPYITEFGRRRVMELDTMDIPNSHIHTKISIYDVVHMEGIRSKLSDEEYRALKNKGYFGAQYDKCPIYFDHKVPDFASSFDTLYAQGRIICNGPKLTGNIIQNCELNEPTCPFPPYKNPGGMNVVMKDPSEI